MDQTLTAYRTSPDPFTIIAAPHKREWMDETPDRFAYRCLPMVIANQAGWWILNPTPFRALWLGGAGLDRIVIESPDDEAHVESHFGSGILTFSLPWLFRTSPGWNILARGPANYHKDGIMPLEGLVETDWSTATFTMNWRFTSQGTWVHFLADEPICQITPMRRGDLEGFSPIELPITTDPELADSHEAWGESRLDFNEALAEGRDTALVDKWQRHYTRGVTRDGHKAPEHQTQLRLQPFLKED